MIEVEKKFQPNKEQTEKLIKNAELKSEKIIIDLYFDTADFGFAKKNMWLRERDGKWELKIYHTKENASSSDVADEITEEKEILEHLGYQRYNSIIEFKKENLSLLGIIKTERKKYLKEGFVIDFDKTDFSENTEIELQVNDTSEIDNANRKIIDFAAQLDLKEVDLPLKPMEFLKRMRPDIYNEIFKNNEGKNEFKIR